MLDVIGAGANASSEVDWRDAWLKSSQAVVCDQELDRIHAEGRERPVVGTAQKSTFATTWGYQFATLTMRMFTAYWRNPTYVMSKISLNVLAGLLVGFTFFKAKVCFQFLASDFVLTDLQDTIQGIQNKVFAVFMASVLSFPVILQIQVMYVNVRNASEIRELPSKMYSWTALVASQIVVELPYNILSTGLFFLCWYWPIGFPSDRAGYTYLLFGIIYPLYYTTLGQAVASMAPNGVIANVLFSTMFCFVIMFDEVVQPARLLGWWYWMYRVTPFTYFLEGVIGQAVGHQEVNCAAEQTYIHVRTRC